MLSKIKIQGFIMAAISAAIYGTNPAFVMPLYADGMNSASVLLLRYLMGVPILAFLILRLGEGFFLHKNQIAPVACMGMCMAVSSLSLYESYLYMNPGIASTMLFMYPVLTALLMTLFFHEKFRLITGVCLLIMATGLYFLMIGPQGIQVNLKGIIWVTISSLTYAVYLIMVKVIKPIKSLPTLKSLFYQLLFGSWIFVILIFFKHWAAPPGITAWLLLICLAIFPTVLSLLFTMKAVVYVGPTPTAILGALEPVTAVLLSVCLLGESITLREIFGGALILLATLLVVLSNKN